jgi:hypothetical protein
MPLKVLSFGKAVEARPQSEDLPQVTKQGFRELELEFYFNRYALDWGTIFILGIPTFFPEVLR